MSLLMVSLALVFPSFLRREKVLEWGLLVSALLLIPLGIMLIRDYIIATKEKKCADKSSGEVLFDPKEKEVDVVVEKLLKQKDPEISGILSEYVNSEAVHIETEELMESIEEGDTGELLISEMLRHPEVIEEESKELIVPEVPIDSDELAEIPATEEVGILEWAEEPVKDREVRTGNSEFSLGQLIEKGFQAKEQGRYHLAAEWFILALDKKPSYDIAYYLIVEACEYWMNGLSTHDALDKVAPYFNEYIQNAPSEWGMKLMEWLENEKLPFPGNYLGRID